MFELHPQLAKDCIVIGDLPLCRVLLMNNSALPWFILVPCREALREIFELTDADQQQFLRESSAFAKAIAEAFAADKLNIAAIGNVVPQLHIHHVVRYKGDPAWPAPVWGNLPPSPYTEEELSSMQEKSSAILKRCA